MRSWATICFMLLATSCIPSGDKGPPRRAPDRTAVAQGPSELETLQCRADLRRAGIGFRALPDQRFAGGCSALGAVQLLDIGTPVANLGAMTCPLARAFAGWVREAVQPAASAAFGSKVTRIESFGTYSCRPVNSQAGARLSEHGRANAVDIATFVLADGRRIGVASGWNGENDNARRFLRAVHQAGCRRFRIGLGPDADAWHRDHLHFDMGQGPYCR